MEEKDKQSQNKSGEALVNTNIQNPTPKGQSEEELRKVVEMEVLDI